MQVGMTGYDHATYMVQTLATNGSSALISACHLCPAISLAQAYVALPSVRPSDPSCLCTSMCVIVYQFVTSTHAVVAE